MSGLTYADYLRLDELMTLQQARVPRELSTRVWTSEHFFIVTHQCCELWISQMLVDLDAAVAELAQPESDLEAVHEYVRRSVAIMEVLVGHVTVLNALPVECFAAFREYLGTASGAQSPHFRALDRMLGLASRPSPLEAAFIDRTSRGGLSPADLWESAPSGCPLQRIATAMLELGQAHWTWKTTHAGLVGRFLGSARGTGGTSGADHLARKLVMAFPELRDAQRRALLDPPDRRKIAS